MDDDRFDDVRTALEILEPVLDEVVISQNSSSRAVPADQLESVTSEEPQ